MHAPAQDPGALALALGLVALRGAWVDPDALDPADLVGTGSRGGP